MNHVSWFDFVETSFDEPSISCVEAPVLDGPSYWAGELPDGVVVDDGESDETEETGETDETEETTPSPFPPPPTGCSQVFIKYTCSSHTNRNKYLLQAFLLVF